MACLCEKIAGKDIDLSPTCIGNLWIFQNIEPAELEALSREALRKKSATGQALFLQGDPTDEMFLIKGGLVKLSKVLEDGTELTLDIRKAGDFVGENMFSEEGRYPVSAQGTVIQFPLTHEDMSFLTGAHRVSITRAMKALKAAGKIIHEDNRLILPALKTA